MKKLKQTVCVFMALAATPLAFAPQVHAESWKLLYSSRWWNGTELTSQVVTPDGTDTPYTLEEWDKNEFPNDPFDVKITAPTTNAGGNLREFFWPANTPEVMNAQTCAVWSKQTDGFAQQGAALRISQTSSGVRGITVTKNIWMGASWVFNVHVWDTSNKTKPFTQIAGFDMSEVMGKMYFDNAGNFQSNLKPFPWRFCARTVGNQLTFKVWTSPWTTPGWDDPKHTRTVTIPDEWVQAGKTGWYIGHVRPGHSAEFQNAHAHALEY